MRGVGRDRSTTYLRVYPGTPRSVEVVLEAVGSPAGRDPLRTGEDDVEADEDLDLQEYSGRAPGVDEARIVIDFSVGSSGVGPVMGIGSGDFFPSAPYADPIVEDARAGGRAAESP